MTAMLNEQGQPLGRELPGWQPRPLPAGKVLEGQYCRLEPVDAGRHAESLSQAYAAAGPGAWTYLPADPPSAPADVHAWLQRLADAVTERYYAIVDLASGQALGSVALMRMDPANGVIEVGSVAYSPALRRTRAATEAQYLLMRHVFDDLGYRRYEWKCNALNQLSRAAALRLGFTFEGIFRQAAVQRGRSRDTAWFSILDEEWPQLARAFQAWLEPANFDADGRQRRSLEALRLAGDGTAAEM